MTCVRFTCGDCGVESIGGKSRGKTPVRCDRCVRVRITADGAQTKITAY